MDPFIFVLGRGRSGTTLVRAILDSHPELSIADESHFIVPMASERRRYETPEGIDTESFMEGIRHRLGRWELREDVVRGELAAAQPRHFPDAVRCVYRAYAKVHGKSRYGDKTPIHVIHIKTLAQLFPEARFVHVIRDGRDASLSYMDLTFGPATLAEAAIYWRRFVRRGRRAGAALGPQRYLEVRYEDLVADPEPVAFNLSNFCGLRFDPAMLTYFERADRIVGSTSHYRNVHLPPTRGLRDWRNEMSRRDLAVFEALAGDLLSELGYERTQARPSLRSRADAGRQWAAVQRSRTVRYARRLAGIAPRPAGARPA